jgi:hypothetical protein
MVAEGVIPAERIEKAILLIRGHKVMLAHDLAALYGVETFNLNKAVKRNLGRFPPDFMFQLTVQEFNNLKFQIGRSSWGGRRTPPYAFTEQGVAMLSSVLRSSRAVQVNVEIMRTFVRLRQLLASHAELARKLSALEKKYDEQFKVVFEMETLLGRGAKDLIPVLLYLFHRIDQRCQSGRPTLIVIDEAWLLLARDRFGQKLEEWLRTLPKKNAAVMLATQSLADIERSPYRSIIVESCPTKIYLPNAEARTEQSAALYRALGLNDRQIELLSYATPKKHYFYSSPLGRRLFDMHLGPVARAFVGAGGREDIARATTLIAQHGDDWPYHWLVERGCRAEAHWWQQWREHHQRTNGKGNTYAHDPMDEERNSHAGAPAEWTPAESRAV